MLAVVWVQCGASPRLLADGGREAGNNYNSRWLGAASESHAVHPGWLGAASESLHPEETHISQLLAWAVACKGQGGAGSSQCDF